MPKVEEAAGEAERKWAGEPERIEAEYGYSPPKVRERADVVGNDSVGVGEVEKGSGDVIGAGRN